METNACSRDERAALQISFLSPDQVPRMDRQTLPSSYRFLPRRVSCRLRQVQHYDYSRVHYKGCHKLDMTGCNEGIIRTSPVAVGPAMEVCDRWGLREVRVQHPVDHKGCILVWRVLRADDQTT